MAAQIFLRKKYLFRKQEYIFKKTNWAEFIFSKIITCSLAEAYSEPCQTSKVERFGL